MASATGDREAIECDGNASAMTINMAETGKINNYMASSRKNRHDAHSNNEGPSIKLESAKFGHTSGRTAEGLRRQATKYPHGLNISIQTVTTNEDQHNTTSNGNNNNSSSNNNGSLHASSDLNANYGYSRASTLRSSWGGNNNDKRQTKSDLNDSIRHTSNGSGAVATSDNGHRKYRISMNSSPENLAELQMRRYKYPLTGNYYLDTQDATSVKQPPPLPVLRTYLQRFGRWKYLRWPIIFLASTLLFFGIITYCMWLHDVSVARERYQRRRQEVSKEAQLADNEAQLINFVANTLDVWQRVDESIATTTSISAISTTNSNVAITTDHNRQHLQESTILRAISTQARQPPAKQQQLTTFKYVVPSKGVVAAEKKQHSKVGVDKDRDETMSETTTYASAEAALIPTNVLHYSGFNGHQNSFGVPIEEGHRILRLFNNGLSPNQPFNPTTKSLTKVSPTIPPLAKSKPTHAMSSGFRTTAQDNGCYSTTLPMCQGVLDYDLTYNSTTKLQLNDQQAFQQLVHSNCSTRALEFICVTLEPECRPSHIGILPPCRRICKAVLEACSIIIANWDALNELFDCNIYPDSNDPHKCEDPTRRRDYCYDNEFACYDRTCIPQQWQCDNIKDCAAGEDEESCLICDHQDEFRCRSNEKCVPESVRCDLKYDCFDGSDEEECDEYGSGDETAVTFDEAALNSFPRIFSYASFLSPNQTNEGLYTYITAATDDENGTKFQVHEITNRTSGISTEEVTNSVPGDGPKSFVNFRDSKEIMMTSDTENKFKYSSAATTARLATTHRNNNSLISSGNKASFGATTPLQPAASMRIAITTEPSNTSADDEDNDDSKRKKPANTCAPHQLRCVSGECITVNQLCDKKIDCPDGADELMCIYKEQRSSTTTTMRSSTDAPSNRIRSVRTQSTTVAATTIRTDKRSLTRTTIKRKVKT
ncbi:PREDICTED: uncharacterized protein LOC108973834 [Bactrocera latifrons]|uniref:Atrial natriuretic peptide-converting enzyme n=1 Tax=Bactrocera latifrons TaxID=174628 RepID=A0A0K8UAK4_BACLA|nr:PREDICTED: uncharacterized protein LOC108973834 [Bactrocera latifrons]XP_018796874.1 PREDICTED: uncharacterized protein LOC108973834 [Bactrocera latifrons]XP_018796876.1 PREDICTED: uncharacterized protein LOC108973834 [Bactrocera latifrons]XP_018796877.1 PREDICTED: uncharacterized protein LOC108973834 [Bactrocera latifrons]XP_018796878.1 PREDICTED: uncharacterized protein LOC108973834 [Bactrocera latifrons]XP_018796879.1 PREDICTED: uncharacterized protein LOC108973834 [Bactrocera latifrons]